MGRTLQLGYPDGTPAQLATALAQCQPGDTVQLTAGTYTGEFKVPTGVRVRGSAMADTVLEATGQVCDLAAGGALEASTVTSTAPGFAGVTVSGSGARIDACDFVGAQTTGVFIEGCADLSITNCRFSAATWNAIQAYDASVRVASSQVYSHPGPTIYGERASITLQSTAFDTKPTSFVIEMQGGLLEARECAFACGDIATVFLKGEVTFRAGGCSFQWYRRDDNAIFPGALQATGSGTVEFEACDFGVAEEGAGAKAVAIMLMGSTRAMVRDCRFTGLSQAAAASDTSRLVWRSCTIGGVRVALRVFGDASASLSVGAADDPVLSRVILKDQGAADASIESTGAHAPFVLQPGDLPAVLGATPPHG